MEQEANNLTALNKEIADLTDLEGLLDQFADREGPTATIVDFVRLTIRLQRQQLRLQAAAMSIQGYLQASEQGDQKLDELIDQLRNAAVLENPQAG